MKRRRDYRSRQPYKSALERRRHDDGHANSVQLRQITELGFCRESLMALKSARHYHRAGHFRPRGRADARDNTMIVALSCHYYAMMLLLCAACRSPPCYNIEEAELARREDDKKAEKRPREPPKNFTPPARRRRAFSHARPLSPRRHRRKVRRRCLASASIIEKCTRTMGYSQQGRLMFHSRARHARAREEDDFSLQVRRHESNSTR